MALLPTAVRRAVAHRTRPTRPRLAACILLGRDGRQILRRPPLEVMQPCLLPERPPRINSWTYPVTLWEVSRDAFAWYLRVQKLRETQGLPPIAQEYQITPDYGPMPVPDPKTYTITGKAHFYVALLGNLNARNLD